MTEPDETRRVAITGIGLVTALGIGAPDTWAGLLAGRTGIDRLRRFDASSLRTRLGAEIAELPVREHVTDRRSLRNLTRNDQLGVVGAALAIKDAGLTVTDAERDTAGLFLASHKEISDPTKVLDAVLAVRNDDGTADVARMGSVGKDRFYPLFYVEGLQAASLFYISRAHNLRGANTYYSGHGDAGLTAIGQAWRAVRSGEASVAVAGAFDDATSWWSATSVDEFGILTDRADSAGVRPYAADADGAVLGEGAAFFVLEPLAAAERRGAAVYAEVVGAGAAFDLEAVRNPSGALAWSAGGSAVRRAVGAALDRAEVGPEEVDLVVASGAATRNADGAEVAGLLGALNGRAERVTATTPVPATGHLMAGSGALNAAVAALALAEGTVPAVGNLTEPAADCAGLDWVTGAPRELRARHAVALGHGADGQVSTLLLAAPGSGGRRIEARHE